MEQVERYSKAFVELKEIMRFMSDDLIQKIPERLKNNIQRIENKDYNFVYDSNLPLYEQNLLEETKALLSVLYSDYLCDEDERAKWKAFDSFELEQRENLKKQKYNPNALFMKSDDKECEKEVSMVKYQESIIKKIWNKISNFIRRF